MDRIGFQIYRPFLNALADLPVDVTDQARRFVMKFFKDPGLPGFRLKRLNNSELWSARVTRDYRAILAQVGGSWLLLHLGHHDQAYEWAAAHRFGSHPKTGEPQVITPAEFVESTAPVEPGVLKDFGHDILLRAGVPESWLDIVREIPSLDGLLDLVDSLPEEVVERLIGLAQGQDLEFPEQAGQGRSFVGITDPELLRRLLKAPLEQWVAFLHPEQRSLVEGDFAGPVQVTGGAGTGKTVVAVHRAHYLATRGRRVLLTSFVTTLCDNICRSLGQLGTAKQRRHITVAPVYEVAQTLLSRHVRGLTAFTEAHKFLEDEHVLSEWEQVIDRDGLTGLDEYCRHPRPGRSPLPTATRRTYWEHFRKLRSHLESQGSMTYPEMCRRLAALVASGKVNSPYDSVVVDEVQDLEPNALKLLACLAGPGRNRLMLIGDSGQRIYGNPVELSALGIDTRTRRYRLRLNYRTTEEIRSAADRLLQARLPGLDGELEERQSVSLLRGPEPCHQGFGGAGEQVEALLRIVSEARAMGVAAEEIAIFCRASKSFGPLTAALQQAGHGVWRLDGGSVGAGIRLGTMHRAKGLEFKWVIVADCSADQLPHPRALAQAADPGDRELALNREVQLLYVSLTRARDRVYVTYVGQMSPLLEALYRK